MLKDIWDTITGNYRYIKYDGSEFHRTKGWSIIDRPELKVGVAVAALNIAMQAYINNDLGNLLTGQFNDVAKLTYNSIKDTAHDFAFGAAFGLTLNNFVINMSFPKKGSTIDTHGTSLSRAQINLADISGLKNVKLWGGMFAAIDLISFSSQLFGDTPHLSVDRAIFITQGLLAFDRASKLLKGDYVFCDEPPKKRQKQRQKSSIFGGVTSPQ